VLALNPQPQAYFGFAIRINSFCRLSASTGLGNDTGLFDLVTLSLANIKDNESERVGSTLFALLASRRVAMATDFAF